MPGRRAVEWKTTSTVLDRLDASNSTPTWNDILSRFRNPIIRFAQQMGLPRQDAEDVSQETLMAFVISYRDKCYDRSKGRLSKWLFGIATRQILNARRRLAVRGVRVRLGNGTSFWSGIAGRATGTALWVREWERAVLQGYLDEVRTEVTAVTYRAFEMTIWAGRTPAEAASELGITIKAVYNAKHRILKRIRQLREEYENAILGEAEHVLP